MARAPEPEPVDEDAGQQQSDAQLKAMLKFARIDPIGAAILIDADRSAIVSLARNRTGKQLTAVLKKDNDDPRLVLWGTAKVDMADDPKKVTFTLNKEPTGVERLLKLTLKATGYTRVAITKG